MKIIVASGKGGTGKTLVATSLAVSLSDHEPVRFLDCDVEEPDAHLFLRPELHGSTEVTIPVPVVDEAACTRCGLCAEICAYHAIAVIADHVLTFPQLCHGCGACSHFCPESALTEEGRATGSIEWGKAGNMRFLHGRLTVGEAMAPPVIRRLKHHADSGTTVIVDAPPGTSCPVVETLRDGDFCLLVTEPTPFGLNDLRLAVETVRLMDMPCGVVLNRAGSGDALIEDYCRSEDIPVLLTIPLNREIAAQYSRGVTLAEAFPEWKPRFTALANIIRKLADERTCCPER